MHHAGAEDFQPAGILANGAAFSAAQETFHIHFGGRFSKGEIGSAKARAYILSEHTMGKLDERAFQVGEGDALAHASLPLVELDFRAGRDLFARKHMPGKQCEWAAGLWGSARQTGACMNWPGEVCVRNKIGLSPRPSEATYNDPAYRAPGDEAGSEQLKVHLVGFHLARGVNLEAHLGQNSQHTPQLLRDGCKCP